MFFIANRNKECRELMIFYVTIKIISLTLKWSDLEEGVGGVGWVALRTPLTFGNLIEKFAL